MINKKVLNALLFVLMLTGFHQALAHGGGGGGGGSSYDFDKRDYAAEQAAEKKVAEQKNDQDDWADFMNAVNTPKQKKDEKVTEDHDHHGDTE